MDFIPMNDIPGSMTHRGVTIIHLRGLIPFPMHTRLIRILFGLVAASALLFAGFFAVGQLIPQVEVSATVTIARPVAEVFAAFNDPFDRMDWMEGYEGTERVSGSPGMPGSVFTVFMSHDGKKLELREVLKAYGENELVEVVLENDLFSQRMRTAFEASGEHATMVTMTGTVQGNSWFVRSMMGLARDRIGRQEAENLLRLKELVEAR